MQSSFCCRSALKWGSPRVQMRHWHSDLRSAVAFGRAVCGAQYSIAGFAHYVSLACVLVGNFRVLYDVRTLGQHVELHNDACGTFSTVTHSSWHTHHSGLETHGHWCGEMRSEGDEAWTCHGYHLHLGDHRTAQSRGRLRAVCDLSNFDERS